MWILLTPLFNNLNLNKIKKNYLWSVLAIIMALTLSVSLVSCGGGDDDGGSAPAPAPAASITVNGLSAASLTFEGNFNGRSGSELKQYVSITSNVAWTMSSNVNWLHISPSSGGSGTMQVEIYPTSENEKSSNREATITLTGDGASATINIVQTGGKPVCYVEPANMVALYNQISFEYTYTSEVNTFRMICLSEREFKRLTDTEIIRELEKVEANKAVDDYLTFLSRDNDKSTITSNSTYYICTIAYNEKEVAGELKKTSVTTPAYYDENSDAWVTFDNASYGTGGFQFDVVKRGYCNTYHLIYGNLPSGYTYPSSLYAFEINYYLKYNKKHWFAENWELDIKTNYINNDTFRYTTSTLSYFPLIVAYGWGVFKDGKISSDMNGFNYDTSSSSSAPKFNKISSANDGGENIVIKRSEEEKAKGILIMR